jgi:acetyltransferase-like isoleucine patch superfamily enzyme
MSLRYRIRGIRKVSLSVDNMLFNLLWRRKLGVRIKIFGWPIISVYSSANLHIGHNLVLISDAYFSEPGVAHPVMIRVLNTKAEILIGHDVGISGGGICAAEKVVIGDNVMFGANAFVTDTDFHPMDGIRRYRQDNMKIAPVKIGNNVFLGMNVLVLKGVTIGDNSIIAAGSVVTTDMPANCIAGGIPARILRRL